MALWGGFIIETPAEAQIFIATLRGGKAIDPRLLFSNDTAAAFTSAGGGSILLSEPTISMLKSLM